MLLTHPSTSVLIGRWFPFERVGHKYGYAYHYAGPGTRYRHEWRQIVRLTNNPIQIRNFLKRCRQERVKGSRHHYLIAFELHHNDEHCLDVKRLFDARRDDGNRWSMIVYGTACFAGVPEWLLPTADYLLEVAQPDLFDGAPLMWAKDLRGGTVAGLLDVPTDAEVEDGRWKGECALVRDGRLFQHVWDRRKSWAESRKTVPVSKPVAGARGYGAPAEDRPGAREEGNDRAPEAMDEPTARRLLELPERGRLPTDVVKRNYRRLILKLHPDKPEGDADQFVRVKRAYEFVTRFVCS